MRVNKMNWNQLLKLVDPVAWLEVHTGFKPFPYQALVLRDHGIRTRVIRKARQVGMTATIAQEAIWKAYTRNNKEILIVSPSDRQSKIVMNKIIATIGTSEELSNSVVRRNRSKLELDNGSVIISLPNNPNRLRGFSATDIYLDEAAHFLNDEHVMAAIRPMRIATNGTFTIVSTPFGKRGLFWDQYRIAADGGIGVKAYDLCPSTISPLITEEMMERDRQNYTELEFRQEYLGQFIEEVDVFLRLDIIMQCVDPKLTLRDTGESGKYYVLGVDFAKQRDETVVILLEPQQDQKLVARHISAWTGMDYSEQIGRIKLLADSFRIVCGAADQTGVGEAVMEELSQVISCVAGIVFTSDTKMELASIVRSLLEHQQLSLPNDKRLIMQLNGLQYRVSKTGNLLFDSPQKERIHDDYLWALALACYAAKRVKQRPRFMPHTAVRDR